MQVLRVPLRAPLRAPLRVLGFCEGGFQDAKNRPYRLGGLRLEAGRLKVWSLDVRVLSSLGFRSRVKGFKRFRG